MPTHHLLLGGTYKGLGGFYPDPDEGLEHLPELAGHALEIDLPHATDERLLKIANAGRQRIIQVQAKRVAEVLPALELAKKYKALLVNVDASLANVALDGAVTALSEMLDAAEHAGFRMLFETNPDWATQDLRRTIKVCELVPRLRFTLELSNYVLPREMPGSTPELKPLLEPVLDRTEMIRGRVGERLELQAEPRGLYGELGQKYSRVWTEAMRRWRLRSRPGAALMFVADLGDGAYTDPERYEGDLSDRYHQLQDLGDLAQKAWKASARTREVAW